MRILISPPMRFGTQFTGAARRTLEVYSRIPNVSLCVDKNTLKEIDEFFEPLLANFDIVYSSSTSKLEFLPGFITCLRKAIDSDVILSYSEYSLSVIYSYLLSIFSRKPLIIFVHHVTEELRGDSKYYPLIKMAFEHSSGIICLDQEEVYEELKKLFPDKVILTSTNGIDVSGYYTTSEKVCDGLFIGDYGERKGVKYLYKIW
ncbi:glycosyl transferase, partial [Acidianus sp. DSM 29099]|nr:glycosyl transferase [Acidianus sp. RZ1]